MTRMVEILFSPKESVSGMLKLTLGAVCQSVILSVSRCSPTYHPASSSPSKHHSSVDRRLSAASDPLTLALQQNHSKTPCQRSDQHCMSVWWCTWVSMYWVCSAVNTSSFACVFCYYHLSLVTAAVFCLYAVRDSLNHNFVFTDWTKRKKKRRFSRFPIVSAVILWTEMGCFFFLTTSDIWLGHT